MQYLDDESVADWFARQLGLPVSNRPPDREQPRSAMEEVDWDRVDARQVIERLAAMARHYQWPIESDATKPPPDATWTPPRRRGRKRSQDSDEGSQPRARSWLGDMSDLTQESPGRYLMRDEIGRGGQARVLLALDRHMGREIAWKELAPDGPAAESSDGSVESADGSAESLHIQRFLREARITAKLEHPNIVPIYELGRCADGKLYYTMRLVRGETLRSKLKACSSLAERMRLLGPFWDACNAMAFAHANGVIHRDLKPGNIMVGEFGETVLLDWGLAKVRGGDDPRGGELVRQAEIMRQLVGGETVVGAAMGTPSYMSPEQALGEIDSIDERSDVWGLGAVLYEILTGQPPFDSKSVRGSAVPREVIERVTTETPRSALELCPNAPAELAAVATKALRRAREERYQNAREMAEDVSAYMTGRRVTAHEYTSWELVRRFVGRNKVAVGAAALILTVIVAGIVVVGLAYHKEARARLQETIARKQERLERLRAHFHLAQAYAKQAERLVVEQDFLSARIFAAASLANNPVYPGSKVYTAAFATERPESEWLRTKAASVGYQAGFSPVVRLARVLRAADALTRFEFSPDGRVIAAGALNGMVYVWETASGRELLQLRSRQAAGTPALALSRDGVRLATGSDGPELYIRDLEKPDQVQQLTTTFSSRVRALTYSPDGKRIAVSSVKGDLVILDARSGAQLVRLPSSLQAHTLVFSPDGRWLATADIGTTARLFDMQAGVLSYTLGGHSDAVKGVAFSPDGRTLASVSIDQTLRLWEVTTGQRLAVRQPHQQLYAVAFSADGAFLGTSGHQGKVQIWDPSGEHLIATIAGHDDLVQAFGFSPDGRLVATATYDGRLRLWEWRSERRPLELVLGGGVHSNVAFSADGRHLAAASDHRAVGVWDTATGSPQHRFTGGTDQRGVALSPDGKLLVTTSADRTVRVWDLERGADARLLKGHTGVVQLASFSASGRWLASASWDRTVRLWEPASGREIAVLGGHDGWVWDVAFSPDGKLLASASCDRRVRLWDVAARARLATLEGHTDWATGVRFSPDGRRLYSTGKDAVIIEWDVATRKQLRRFVGHERWVNAVLPSSDGRHLATVGDDGLAVWWDLPSGASLLQLRMTVGIDGAGLSPDGKRLGVTNGSGVAVYPLSVPAVREADELLHEAEQAAGMRLQGYELRAIR